MSIEEQPNADEKVSPSLRAYAEAKAKILAECTRMVYGQMDDDPALMDAIIHLQTAARAREVEVVALVDLLVDAKVITRNQFHDRAALHLERYAKGLKEKMDRPRLAIATGKLS